VLNAVTFAATPAMNAAISATIAIPSIPSGLGDQVGDRGVVLDGQVLADTEAVDGGDGDQPRQNE